MRALSDHPRDERLDAVQHAEEVHRDHAVPRVHLVVEEVAPATDAGVEERDVDFAVVVEGLVGEVLHRRQVGDVGRHSDHVVALGTELLDGLVKGFLVEVGEHHLHAVLGEERARGAPDASLTATTGDDRHLACEILHVVPPFPVCRV